MFKLTIECTKDIDSIHIDFSDGSTVETTTYADIPKKHNVSTHEEIHNCSKDNEIIDVSKNYNNSVNDCVVKPPEITNKNRPVKIASELQNLNL